MVLGRQISKVLDSANDSTNGAVEQQATQAE